VGSALVYLFYYYVPVNLVALASRFMPSEASATLGTVLSSVVNPVLPVLGLLLTALVFLVTVLGGSRLHGPLLILEGACFSAYTLLVFQGGTVSMSLPSELLQGIGANIYLDLRVLMLIFLAPSALTMIKGLAIALKGNNPERPT
jgi:hypothetical protein